MGHVSAIIVRVGKQ